MNKLRLSRELLALKLFRQRMNEVRNIRKATRMDRFWGGPHRIRAARLGPDAVQPATARLLDNIMKVDTMQASMNPTQMVAKIERRETLFHDPTDNHQAGVIARMKTRMARFNKPGIPPFPKYRA